MLLPFCLNGGISNPTRQEFLSNTGAPSIPWSIKTLSRANVIVYEKRKMDRYLPGRQWMSAISNELLTEYGGRQFATAPTDMLLKERTCVQMNTLLLCFRIMMAQEKILNNRMSCCFSFRKSASSYSEYAFKVNRHTRNKNYDCICFVSYSDNMQSKELIKCYSLHSKL